MIYRTIKEIENLVKLLENGYKPKQITVYKKWIMNDYGFSYLTTDYIEIIN